MFGRLSGVCLSLFILLLPPILHVPAWSHDEHSNELPDIGLEEKLGQWVPLPLGFRTAYCLQESTHKLADAVGFHSKRLGEDFEHPVAWIILAPDGKIVRYMHGADPLPFDLKPALVEVSQGRIEPTILFFKGRKQPGKEERSE